MYCQNTRQYPVLTFVWSAIPAHQNPVDQRLVPEKAVLTFVADIVQRVCTFANGHPEAGIWKVFMSLSALDVPLLLLAADVGFLLLFFDGANVLLIKYKKNTR